MDQGRDRDDGQITVFLDVAAQAVGEHGPESLRIGRVEGQGGILEVGRLLDLAQAEAGQDEAEEDEGGQSVLFMVILLTALPPVDGGQAVVLDEVLGGDPLDVLVAHLLEGLEVGQDGAPAAAKLGPADTAGQAGGALQGADEIGLGAVLDLLDLVGRHAVLLDPLDLGPDLLLQVLGLDALVQPGRSGELEGADVELGPAGGRGVDGQLLVLDQQLGQPAHAPAASARASPSAAAAGAEDAAQHLERGRVGMAGRDGVEHHLQAGRGRPLADIRFSLYWGGSAVRMGSTSGPLGMRPKYFSAIGIKAWGSKSPT